jgi:hypothetical protein
MAVVQVKQQQTVVQINIKLKQMMMMKKKMNLFILNQVHVLDGKNDVKQYNHFFEINLFYLKIFTGCST